MFSHKYFSNVTEFKTWRHSNLRTLTQETELRQVCQSGGNDVRPFPVQAMQKCRHKLTTCSSDNNYVMFERNIPLL